MPGTTPIYGLPYQSLGDPPHGPNLGQELAGTVEIELARIDTGVAVFTDSTSGPGTFSKPTNPPARVHWVRTWAAGAAGGGVDGAAGQGEGGGGGGGEYRDRWYLDAELAANENYTVGAGGVPVVAGDGGNGGDTTFKDLIAKGGRGGQFMVSTAGSAGAARGAGGSGGSGGEGTPGGDGGPGRVISGQAVFNGAGGSSPYGAGPTNFPNFGAAAGAAGKGPGGGGSGAFGSAADLAGGAGAAGKFQVVSFY